MAKNKIKKKTIMHTSSLIQSVIDRLLHNDYGLESNFINCFTTLHMFDPDTKIKTSYRADPYFYKRPWMDWCDSKWDRNVDDDNEEVFPCRILMFIDTLKMSFEKDISEYGRYLAIVRSSEMDNRNSKQKPNSHCMLIDTFEYDQYIRIISCDSIIKPIFVVPDVESFEKQTNNITFESCHIMRMTDKKEWARNFMDSKWL